MSRAEILIHANGFWQDATTFKPYEVYMAPLRDPLAVVGVEKATRIEEGELFRRIDMLHADLGGGLVGVVDPNLWEYFGRKCNFATELLYGHNELEAYYVPDAIKDHAASQHRLFYKCCGVIVASYANMLKEAPCNKGK